MRGFSIEMLTAEREEMDCSANNDYPKDCQEEEMAEAVNGTGGGDSSLDEILNAVEEHIEEDLEDFVEDLDSDVVKGEDKESSAYGDKSGEDTASIYGMLEQGIYINYEELFSYMGSGVNESTIKDIQIFSKSYKREESTFKSIDMDNETIDMIVRAKKMDNQNGYAVSSSPGGAGSTQQTGQISSAQYGTVSHAISVSTLEKFSLLNKMAHIWALTMIKYDMNGW